MRYKETFLYKKDLILPVFIVNGTNTKREITSLPDVFHYSLDRLVPDLEELILKGLKSILVFGVTERKGIEQAFSKDGIIQKSIPVIKRHFPELEVITDVCLCSYTEDGHCHVGDNDATCEILAKIALSHATAGADIVAPSDMMDGRVHYIKKGLLKYGLRKTGIMSYAAKFASSFYGPFREAANCTPKSGNRKTYQMDYSNSSEAIEEVMADIEE
ncbi:MAG: porphobilinogen synthase, partial [Spirochaetales bacterium]|nr:porphobilinogen synthase [Spirochaetales bacterium]